jgi:hypothetical protein
MNTKLLMAVSAVFIGLVGIAFSFAPGKILTALNIEHNEIILLLTKIFGAVYFGFAILNWMAKDNLIGGVYSRPVAIGNFTHFFVAAIILIKTLPGIEGLSFLWVFFAIYTLFGIAFGYIFFTHPGKNRG